MPTRSLLVRYVLHVTIGPNQPGVYETDEPKSADEAAAFVARWLPVVAAHPVHELSVAPAPLSLRDLPAHAPRRPLLVAADVASQELRQDVHLILSSWTWRYFPPG
jgi:hypothetical protein